ncbi:MAG TPA: NAD(P)H-hydrate dehydratase [Phycisphaerales bacterium]|nr:NAD(P)H-hydrate dehydratase [Phycisphaerales bacterium]
MDATTHPPCKIPARARDAHKGTAGTVVVIGGSSSGGRLMIGAPALTARAALRSGAGLAKIVAPRAVLPHALTLCPSATGIVLETDISGELIAHEAAETFDAVAQEADCIAIGPGLGVSDAARALCFRAVQQEDVPVVVDADAITNLAHVPELTRDFHGACILTPHPGEFRRIAQALGISHDPVNPASRPAAAEHLAQRLGCIVVLKGAGTIVTNGHDTWTCDAGHPCLATAGTGDVLTGLIGGLVAQFLSPRGGRGPGEGRGGVGGMPTTDLHALARARLSGQPVPPAPASTLSLLTLTKLAVWTHARAGEVWAHSHGAQAGLLAADLTDLLPGVLAAAADK